MMETRFRSAPQSVLCRLGHHRWTAWGNYIPVAPEWLKTGAVVASGPPDPAPIEAYRWRGCECGVAERESYDGRDRNLVPHRNFDTLQGNVESR